MCFPNNGLDTVVVELHSIGPLLVGLLGQQHPVDEVRPGGEDSENGKEPTVAELPLLDVARVHPVHVGVGGLEVY